MTTTARILPSPDCQTSTHAHCDETAWDEHGREQVTCPCPCHEGTDPADVEPASQWMDLSELERNHTIATNELRDSTELREHGHRTAAEHAHARNRAARTRAAIEERMGTGSDALFGTEAIR